MDLRSLPVAKRCTVLAVALVLFALSVAGCASGLPENGPAAPTAGAALLGQSVATHTATRPSAPTAPIDPPTAMTPVSATLTDAPSPTATATASQTPTPSDKPALSPTPTRTPFPTITPQPVVTAVLDSGWTQYRVPAGKFSIALPSSWSSDDLSGPPVVVLAPSDPAHIKFMAHADDLASRSHGNGVALLAARRRVGVDMPLHVHSSRALQSLRNLVGPDASIESETVDLGGVEAGRIRFVVKPPGSLVASVFVEYLIPDGEFLNQLIFQAPDRFASNYTPVFDEIADTFRWEK